MKRTFAAVGVAALACTLGVAPARAGAENPYAASGSYVALGDSLAAGYQPGQGDDKTGGYVGGVYANLRSKYQGAKLINLACSGETTVTMVNGGKCDYPGGGSQLQTAVGTIKAAKGKVRLITVDIGANDVQTCVARTGSIDFGCLAAGLTAVGNNTKTIVNQLRAAAPDAQIVLLNYYNPFLVFWLTGNQKLAQLSTQLQAQLNGLIAQAAAGGNAKVADIATAFRSTDWTPTASGVPTNVATICALTWMCSNTDIHANHTGYALMAATVNPLVVGPKRPATASVG